MPALELAEGISQLPREEWNALVGGDSPLLEWDWLSALEEAGCVAPETGWSARPLVARENGVLVAACPLYVKQHSEGEFVFDWGWADAAHRAGIDYYPKLLVGVPFSPVSGSRLLVAPGVDRPQWETRLSATLRQLCDDNELSGVHVNFCTPQEAETLKADGFLSRIGIQYHWHNEGYESFEDYLSRFRSKRRNQIRRELREMDQQGVQITTYVGDDIPDELFPLMYRFYLSTVQGHYYGRQYLNERFFDLLRDRYRHRLVFVVAHQHGEPIAGTFNVSKGDALYGRYWGALRQVRHLHFNVCYYAAVRHCIEAGLARFEPGAGGDYKQMRGFDARPTYSAHFLRDPRLAHAIRHFLDGEREQAARTLDWMQEESALKPAEPAEPVSGS